MVSELYMDCLSHLGKFEAFLCLIDHNWCIGEDGWGGHFDISMENVQAF